MTRLSVVVVNYQGEALLPACLESVGRHAPASCERIVVDNASTDGSEQAVRRADPGARWIAGESNRGFGAAANRGVAAASGDAVLLLNNDARLVAPLDAALELLEGDPAVGAVGARVDYPDGRLQLTAGREHSPWVILSSWLRGRDRRLRLPGPDRVENDPAFYEETHDTAWVSGAVLLTPRALWNELGGMDERYFMYMEDVDYCRRVRDAGGRVVYFPGARAVHAEAGGKSWVGEQALVWTARSYMTYTRKFYGPGRTGLLRVGLGTILAARAALATLPAVATGSEVWIQRARGYRRAARVLWSGDG